MKNEKTFYEDPIGSRKRKLRKIRKMTNEQIVQRMNDLRQGTEKLDLRVEKDASRFSATIDGNTTAWEYAQLKNQLKTNKKRVE